MVEMTERFEETTAYSRILVVEFVPSVSAVSSFGGLEAGIPVFPPVSTVFTFLVVFVFVGEGVVATEGLVKQRRKTPLGVRSLLSSRQRGINTMTAFSTRQQYHTVAQMYILYKKMFQYFLKPVVPKRRQRRSFVVAAAAAVGRRMMETHHRTQKTGAISTHSSERLYAVR